MNGADKLVSTKQLLSVSVQCEIENEWNIWKTKNNRTQRAN